MLELSLDAAVASIKSGEFTGIGSSYVIAPTDETRDIPAGGSVTLGVEAVGNLFAGGVRGCVLNQTASLYSFLY